MCFSATASFSAAAVLLPAGVYCLKTSNQVDKRYWVLAMMPFMFGLQQLLEGALWLSLEQGDVQATRDLALGFLLFSHLFWLVWVSYSSYQVESMPQRKQLFLGVAVFGVLFGVLMFVPLLYHHDWLTVMIVQHSIHYGMDFITDAYVSQRLLAVIYGCVILLPLVLSSDRYHNILGALILVAGMVTWAFYDWAFVSVWCYFAALISLYIFIVVARNALQNERVTLG